MTHFPIAITLDAQYYKLNTTDVQFSLEFLTILLRGLYGKHKHLSCGVILLWKFAFFAPFFDLDQIFATLVANVADMDGDGNVNYEEFVGMIIKGVRLSRDSELFKNQFKPF